MTPPPAGSSAEDVDVVVVTYQSAAHIGACLGSVPSACHVTVVDNASSDGSADLAESLGATVLRNQDNRGFGVAAAQGAGQGDRRLILFLNPDAQLTDGSLATLTAALDARPEVGIVGPALTSPAGVAQRAWWPFPSPGRTWLEALGLYRLRSDRTGPGNSVAFVIGASMLVRRTVFEALGGFDADFWLYGEEADLCRRASSIGWDVCFVPQASVLHVGGASGGGDRGLVFEHFQRGTERFILKHHGRSALVVHRVGVLVGSLARLPPLSLGRTPDSLQRFHLRQRIVARTARSLLTHPTKVSG